MNRTNSVKGIAAFVACLGLAAIAACTPNSSQPRVESDAGSVQITHSIGAASGYESSIDIDEIRNYNLSVHG